MIYGASPDEWAHFDLILGLTADLLPVVSNPKAEKSAESKIQVPGKTPSDYNRHGKMRGFAHWTSHKATPDDIARWSAQPDYGICLQTREVRALDIDIEDFEESVDAESFIKDRLSVKLPIRRRGNSCKLLFAFRLVGDFKKRRFSTKTEKGAIEFLANGQQFVACGTHPSGARYVWPDGLPTDIPTLTEDEFEALWSSLHERFGSSESVTSRSGKELSKPRKASDINDPMVDYLYDEGHVLSQTSDGKIFIRCPNEAEHTTDSGETATAYFPAGVGGYEQGHFACLHSHCQHLTNQDFKARLGYLSRDMPVIEEVKTPPPAIYTGPTKPIQYSAAIAAVKEIVPLCTSGYPDELSAQFYERTTPASGKTKHPFIVANTMTITVALECPHLCGALLGYDTFRDEYAIKYEGMEWRAMRDSDYLMMRRNLENLKGYKFDPIPRELFRECVMFVAEKNSFDSQAMRVRSYKWDGVKRVETFLRDFFGGEDTPYTRAVSLYFWSALAGRSLVPGIKADMAPIAVGRQGSRKTSLVQAIAPETDMFVELDFSKSDDDLARDMRGKVIAECGEMKGIGAKQNEHIKSFMSRGCEVWTPKYKEFTTRYYRRCMMIGTTNEDEPLPEDETGHRRWLPFKVNQDATCGVDKMLDLREQLWAEGVVLFDKHGVMWDRAESLAKPQHADFRKTDSWEDILHEHLFGKEMGDVPLAQREGGLSLQEIIRGALHVSPKDINQAIEKRVGKCLRQIGMKKVVKSNRKVWVPA